MNKVVFISIIVLLLVAISSSFYISSKKLSDSEKMMKKETSSSEMNKQTPDAMAKETSETMMKKENGKYIEYSDPSTLEIKNSKIVLFFYANWCPTCIPADKEFKKNESNLPEGVTIVRVNYNDTETDNNEKDLAKKYGITYQHTYVQIDESGNAINKWNGGALDELVSNIK